MSRRVGRTAMSRLGIRYRAASKVTPFAVHAIDIFGSEVLLLLIRLLMTIRGGGGGVVSSWASTVTAVSTRHNVVLQMRTDL